MAAPEKHFCSALVGTACLVAAGLGLGGLALIWAAPSCRRSPIVELALWSCLAMVVVFGRGHF